MKFRLIHPHGDFDPEAKLVANVEALTQDLSVATLLEAMARGDKRIEEVCRKVLFAAGEPVLETVRYRQEVARDAASSPELFERLYALCVQTLDENRKRAYRLFERSPDSVLRGSIKTVGFLVDQLVAFRHALNEGVATFESRGMKQLAATLAIELDDECVAAVRRLLEELRFEHGVPLQMSMGAGLAPDGYVLSRPASVEPGWWRVWWDEGKRVHSYRLHERDEAGATILGQMKDRGFNEAANALGQAADHILAFVQTLCHELAFHVGGINLAKLLGARGAPQCFPELPEPGRARVAFAGLRDASLAIVRHRTIKPNALETEGKPLTVVTGANQGGKSSFLRSLGLAQLMMQAGLFVVADAFTAPLATGVFTHFKREEDRDLVHGKFAEELERMSGIVDDIHPGALMLFNESFASTNDREGSMVAVEVVEALLERGIRIVFVTHLIGLARALQDRHADEATFLRAERLADGTRPFTLVEADPLPTAYGADVYAEVFGDWDAGISNSKPQGATA